MYFEFWACCFAALIQQWFIGTFVWYFAVLYRIWHLLCFLNMVNAANMARLQGGNCTVCDSSFQLAKLRSHFFFTISVAKLNNFWVKYRNCRNYGLLYHMALVPSTSIRHSDYVYHYVLVRVYPGPWLWQSCGQALSYPGVVHNCIFLLRRMPAPPWVLK